jgi:hypothetical protein
LSNGQALKDVGTANDIEKYRYAACSIAPPYEELGTMFTMLISSLIT